MRAPLAATLRRTVLGADRYDAGHRRYGTRWAPMWRAGWPRNGAEHLVLTSRRGLEAPGARRICESELTELGAKVTVAACDVADRAAQVEALLAGIPAEYPLTGVVHTAAVHGRRGDRGPGPGPGGPGAEGSRSTPPAICTSSPGTWS
ncbi:KR domain-containing protein [Streptomyces sp. Mo3]|uniref:KR domain-containing protein n=1 Tax=Streptomyces sp. Mo3 TaxID=3161190 RepID=UPI0039EF4FEB